MAKRILLFSIALVAAVVFLGGIFAFIGNPVNGDTWSHPLPGQSGINVDSHRMPLWPLSIRRHIGKHGDGNVVTLGHIYYIWETPPTR